MAPNNKKHARAALEKEANQRFEEILFALIDKRGLPAALLVFTTAAIQHEQRQSTRQTTTEAPSTVASGIQGQPDSYTSPPSTSGVSLAPEHPPHDILLGIPQHGMLPLSIPQQYLGGAQSVPPPPQGAPAANFGSNQYEEGANILGAGQQTAHDTDGGTAGAQIAGQFPTTAADED
ncbi:uncharacterized protein B0I36DRAFT_366880 [Microdochium trichocladiopsis]|uniref:Uncharacterized protein n=1 Tax=Microdochium trichocladiopsis TaxID=1682393 RepID=A0A9P8Y194_9PEZI|nr:uncharacterized protein B0I36DRAFT_366880 [Microdochium trichocladiopsis]KAH7024982.1 hypothetical protein B0I36DRAFT_366880 [Microdochium trichocladiopsis]